MGRPLEFDRDEALDVAMRVFWSKGFEATSLHDLLQAMDLSKSSFYQSYGSKHELLQRSIHRYSASVTDTMRARLAQAPSGRRFIETVFDELTEITAAITTFIMIGRVGDALGVSDPVLFSKPVGGPTRP